MFGVAILSLSSALIISKIMTRPDEAGRIAAKQDIGELMDALNSYRRDNGRYPSEAQGLHALIEKPHTEPVPHNWKEDGYLERLPNDPWGNAYQYLNPGVHGEIDVLTYGKDARQGGEGDDADIGSWE
ncbi:type II secretion system protein GspG (plasmid) [Paraburkholderia largidicola]|uniref:Type II secretion system protein GspG n=2 Tax=Paraburkholderia largidicola TaxID=3014751 RepID=A0A7I8C259_9BURK|nr:type II secretion system protein GspG [Paraburkholderia sp. PGU16]